MTDVKRAAARFAMHEHSIIRGPRANRTGNWPAGMGSTFAHSHEGGDKPHAHPDTGPAAFRRQKLTARPHGEQFPYVPQELQTFGVFVLDSAKVFDPATGELRQIRPADEIGTSLQADHIEQTFKMRAVVHDLRTRRALPVKEEA